MIPANPEAETMALACAMQYPEILDEFIKLAPDDFHSPLNRKIYNAIMEQYLDSGEIDIIQLATITGKNVTKMLEISNLAYSPSIFHSTLKELQEQSRRRMLLKLGDQLKEKADNPAEDSKKIMEEAADLIEQVSVSGEKEPELLSELLGRRAEAYMQGDYKQGIATGLIDLDNIWAGMFPGELTIIAARPSMGKTALAMQIAERVAQKTGHPSIFFSLEMTAEYLADRRLSGLSGINLDSMRRGYASKKLLTEAQGKIKKFPRVYVADESDQTTFKIMSQSRKLKRREGLSAIFVDFLTLLTDEKQRGESEHLHVSSVTRKIRSIAKTLNMPVVLLAQLSRSVESRDNKRPKMSDLRESGGIEEAADNILFLYRDEYYNPNTEKKGITEINIAKQKQGPRGGVAEVVFMPELGEFKNKGGN